MRFLGWKARKSTSGRLRMGSVFGYGCVSFDESLRTIVHCMTVYHISTCILLNCWKLLNCYNYRNENVWVDQLWWNVYFVFTWTLVIPINPLGVRHPTEQCGMLTSSFLNLFRCKCRSRWSANETVRAWGCLRRFWSSLEDFVILGYVGLFENIF